MRGLLSVLAVLFLIALGLGILLWRAEPPLPSDLAGTVVYVSDRSGMDSLYLRRLPGKEDRLLARLTDPAREPALSPDGREVAFSSGGRIGLVSVPTGRVRILTLGVEYRDASPSWRPDGKALAIASRRAGETTGDIHVLELARDGVSRSFLTETTGLDETAPAVSPDGRTVVFVREDGLFRLELPHGRTRRITSGFRRMRAPRFLPSGRLLALWSDAKLYGLDVMDLDGRNRETLLEGSVYYRNVVPSPDGRFLAATYTFDLRFHPTDALKLRQTEEVRLLDARGRSVGPLARSLWHASHSPDWGK